MTSHDHPKRKPTNLVASIQQRLLTIAHQQHEEMQFVLTRYAIERLLYRLGCSPYADKYILKGAMLFVLWQDHAHRPTRDVDFLGSSQPDSAIAEQMLRELSQISLEDGLLFQEKSVRSEAIREEQRYGGLRLHILAKLGNARIPLQIDIGYGDAVVPPPAITSFPAIIPEFPSPQILVYPQETVVAEKYQAMVDLGIANTRMKDFADLWILARQFSFSGVMVCAAIQATFNRRGSPFPQTLPIALTGPFAQDSAKQAQWKAFRMKGHLTILPENLAEVITVLRDFLWPPTESITAQQTFDQQWPEGGPWQSS